MIDPYILAAGVAFGIAWTLAGLLVCAQCNGPYTLMRALGLVESLPASLLAIVLWPLALALGTVAARLQVRRAGATYRAGRI